MKNRILASGFAVMTFMSAAQAAPFGDLYAFGDSLADCCFSGPFTQGNTDTWVDLLPDQIGASYQATQDYNLAIGGAQSGPTNAIGATDTAFGFLTGFTSQIGRFLTTPLAASVDPSDIAVIWVGTNDIWAAPFSGGASPIGPVNTAFASPPTPEELAAYVTANIASGIEALRDVGFGSVAVLSPYDIANAAFVVTPDTSANVSAYSGAVRDSLGALYTPGIDTYFLDMVGLLEDIQNDADALGFDFLTGAENCDAGAAATLGPGSSCIDLPTTVQDSYVFADFIHLSNATNQIIAAELAATINAGNTTPAPIPLPASLLFLLSACGGLAGLRQLRGNA